MALPGMKSEQDMGCFGGSGHQTMCDLVWFGLVCGMNEPARNVCVCVNMSEACTGRSLLRVCQPTTTITGSNDKHDAYKYKLLDITDN